MIEDVVIEVEADHHSQVSAKVRAMYDESRFASSLCYQWSHNYRSWGWNPLRWFQGPRTVKVWRAWFSYRRD